MRRLKDKGGAAHFEMIVSFVFFAGFIVFLFLFLDPQDDSVMSDSVIDSLYESFQERVNTNLSSVFIGIDSTGVVGCFNVSLPNEEIFNYEMFDDGSYVETLDGTEVDSDLQGRVLNVDFSEDYYRIKFSPEFVDDVAMAPCSLLIAYELGGIVEREIFSYSALQNMSALYYSDYSLLKDELGFPEVFEFAILTGNLGFDMGPAGGIPSSIEVASRSYTYEVLNSSGAITSEEFVISSW
jgi:hypothetical protein